MATCGRCGSIQLSPRTTNWLVGVAARLMNTRSVRCGRCGWRGRVRRSARLGERRPSRRRTPAAADAAPLAPPPADVNLDALDRVLEARKVTPE